MTFTLLWNRVLGFVKQIPDWAWWALLAVLTWRFIDMSARHEERVKQKARNATQRAEVKVAVNNAQHEVIQEEVRNANDALQARDGPLYPDAASVPDDVAAVLFRRGGGGAGGH